MKRLYKTILHSALFIIILIAILILQSYLFKPKTNQPGFGMKDISANGILGEKENTIDVLFLGDSEAYCSFSPMEMYDKYGFTSYVCGTSAQVLYYADHFLKQAFKTQKPKVVVLETDEIYRKFDVMDLLGNKIINILPVFLYHDRWKSLNTNDLTYKVNYTYTDDFKGFNYNNSISGTSDNGYMTPNNHVEEIPLLNQNSVKKIIKFCKENNVEVILLSTPSTVNWNYSKHLGIEKFANENQVKYIDLNQVQMQEAIDWQKDTKDHGDHMNYSGALKVSKCVGKYLKEEYSLEDRKSDKNYTQWNETLTRYNKVVGK